MDERQRRKQDPLSLPTFGAALTLLVGLLLYVLVFKAPESKTAEPATPVQSSDLIGELRRKVVGLTEKFRGKPAPQPVPQAAPKAALKSVAPAVAAPGSGIEPGHTWRYAVVVEPPVWRDITLTYRTRREGAGIGVLTDFVYAGGKMNFHLGTYAAGHPSHANTRFPGFFMHASYLPPSLKVGQHLAWGWPWQPVRAGRTKRYEGQVTRWENIQVPAGVFVAAVIETELLYIEADKVQARARETLWYVPELAQVVKVLREGQTPDEGSRRIVAELVEYR